MDRVTTISVHLRGTTDHPADLPDDGLTDDTLPSLNAQAADRRRRRSAANDLRRAEAIDPAHDLDSRRVRAGRGRRALHEMAA
jgi:hypothetical protein